MEQGNAIFHCCKLDSSLAYIQLQANTIISHNVINMTYLHTSRIILEANTLLS